MRNFKRERFLWLILVCMLSSALFFRSGKNPILAAEDPANINRNFMLLQNIFQKIMTEYVDEQDSSDLIHNAIDGMIKGLGDPHSALLKPKNYEDLQTGTKGKYGGLGIVVGIRDNKLTVISPMEDTPAMEVGLEAGDQIIEINKTNQVGIALDKAVEKLRGEAGTDVNITVEREDVDEPLDFTITREIIDIKSVKHSMIGTNTAYIRITSFARNTPEQLRASLKDMKDYESMIVDLRNNPGGLLDVALTISDMFLENEVIVSTKGRVQRNNQIFRANPGTVIDPDIPLIVLVNKGSASASEIFSGAIQDTGRGILLGTQTYGKGSVQTVLTLDEGYGLRMTISRYYTPADRMIDKKGLKPDITVEPLLLTPEESASLRRLDRTNYISEFVKKYPDSHTDQEFKELIEELTERDFKVKESLIRSRIDYKRIKEQPIFDLENDNQLRQAIEILQARKILEGHGR